MTDDDAREPGRAGRRRREDDVDDLTTPEPDAHEVAAGRDALRELGAPGPVPADVLARLEGRLEGELGRDAPVRRVRPARRRRRLRLLAPGLGLAIAAVAVVVVIETRGSSAQPAADRPVSAFQTQRTAQAPKAAAGSSAQDSAAPAVAAVLVPALVGHTLKDAERLLRARGLIVSEASGRCPPAERVTRQRPAAGTHAARGAQITLSTSSCAVFSSP
jgi:hypothetical protein